jgi:hypothetical protein
MTPREERITRAELEKRAEREERITPAESWTLGPMFVPGCWIIGLLLSQQTLDAFPEWFADFSSQTVLALFLGLGTLYGFALYVAIWLVFKWLDWLLSVLIRSRGR